MGVVPGKITLWDWPTLSTGEFRHRLDIDTWTTGTFSIQVVAAPDGRRIAVTEFGGDSKLNRARVFDATGRLLWTSPAAAAPMIDLAWSPDGTELALSAIPSPWTVLVFSPNGQVDATTYDVSGANAYRVIGFAPDDAHLIGYETSGEAAFTDKPVSLDLAHGVVQFMPLDVFPAGMASNATTSWQLDRINPGNGDVLAIVGEAKGTPEWVLQRGSSRASFGLDLSVELVWADASTIAYVGAAPPVAHASASATPGSGLGLWRTTGPGVQPHLVATFPGLIIPRGAGGTPLGLIGARDGFALLYVGAPPCCVGTGNGYSKVMLVNVHTAASVVGVVPAGAPAGTTFLFAGWISAPN
jgi:hypothetical protein